MKYTFSQTLCWMMFCALSAALIVPMGLRPQSNTIIDNNPLMPRIVMHYALHCQSNGMPVSEPVQRYCDQLATGDAHISDDDRALIAEELLEHWDVVRAYIERVYKTWTAAGAIPEEYRAATRAANCDTASVFGLITDISNYLIMCCTGYDADFSSTWTALAALETDITVCCSNQQANFVGTWTIINSLINTPSCGPVTVITQSDIDAVNGYTITSSGNYCLGTDIVYNGASLKAAINISCSQVFLDMNNHEIQSIGDLGTGIQINDTMNDITIIKGNFNNCGQGIRCPGQNSNIIIKKCLFENISYIGIEVDASAINHTIAHCVFNNIIEAMVYQNANTIVVHDCIMTGATAINVVQGSNIIIYNCIASSQSDVFAFTGVSSLSLNNCVITLATSDQPTIAIYVAGCHTVKIQSCLISNSHSAITFDYSSSDCFVTECYLYQNQVGILFQNNSYSCVVDRCISSYNSAGITFNDALSHDIIIQNTLLAANSNGINYGNSMSSQFCALLNNNGGSFIPPSSFNASTASIENCIFNTALSFGIGGTPAINSIVRNNEAFSCGSTSFINSDTSNHFYNNNAFNCGNGSSLPAYSLAITNTFNVNTPDPLTGTVGDILRNLTNTN